MWPNPQIIVDLVTFTEEVLNGKPDSLCSDCSGVFIVEVEEEKVIYAINIFNKETPEL